MIFFQKNRLFVLGCLLPWFFFNTGCKKDRIHYYISDEVKKYGFFQQHSYWIYYNDITQRSDCTYIDRPLQIYTANITDPWDKPLIDNIFIYFESPFLTSNHLIENRIITEIKYPLIGCISFISDIKNNLGKKINNSTYRRIGMYDSLDVLDQRFYNVLHTSYSSLLQIGSEDSLIYQFYMVPDIGMVKITKSYKQTDTVWSLQRYHVVQ